MITVAEIEKLAAERRETPREVELYRLEPGDLFMCNLGAHRGYLYKFHRNVYVGGKLDHSLAWEVADGELTTRNQGKDSSNWNPYCGVYKVRPV